MSSRSRHVLLVVLLALIIAVTLLLVFRNSVREVFVIPLLYLVWLGGLIFNSVHQGVFWALLLVLVAILFANSLQRKPGTTPPIGRIVALPHKSRRVAYWAGQIARNENKSFYAPPALEGFRDLIIAVWASRTNRSPWEVERDIQAGRLQLPPELASFFQQEAWWQSAGSDESSPNGHSSRRLEGCERAWVWLRSLFRPDRAPAAGPFEQHVHSMIQTLENQLEAKRDHRNHPGSRTR
jgi:hypothetical protein